MWYKVLNIIDWFGEHSERSKLIRNFNTSAKTSFISGEVPTLLEAKVTRGDKAYKHMFSKWFGGGFRIKVLSGEALPQSDLISLAKIVLSNEPLMRKMVTVGFDTLEIYDTKGLVGIKFPLTKYINIGKFINT